MTECDYFCDESIFSLKRKLDEIDDFGSFFDAEARSNQPILDEWWNAFPNLNDGEQNFSHQPLFGLTLNECISPIFSATVCDITSIEPFASEDEESRSESHSESHSEATETPESFYMQPQMCENFFPATTKAAPVNLSASFITEPNSAIMDLRLCSSFEKLWYSGRPFPSFTIELVDSLSGKRVHVNGWKVLVSVVDGNDNDASDKVCDVVRNHLYEIVDGCTSIVGLRFLTVSSKCGGHYRVVIRLVSSSSNEITQSTTPFISENIQILSYRLFHVPKVENEALSQDDPISKMKGIGTLTSKRFGELGIKTVAQLAKIDADYLGDQGCSLLLNHLRKNRGSLTRPKLYEYITMARDIVDRSAKCGNQSNQVSCVPASPQSQSLSNWTQCDFQDDVEYASCSRPAKRHCPGISASQSQQPCSQFSPSFF
jgi:hypothetical protein